jgi:hydrogenase expression/formation protein HypD
MDAASVFGLPPLVNYDPPGCLCGSVIQGKAAPPECALFGGKCTPESPVGPCMVSSEGTCAAYLRYGGGESTRNGRSDR